MKRKQITQEDIIEAYSESEPEKSRKAQKELAAYKMAIEFMIVGGFMDRGKFDEAHQFTLSFQK